MLRGSEVLPGSNLEGRERSSRSFPLLQDALLDQASLNVWSHRIGHWLTPRASLSKQMRKIFKKNLFTEHHALPRSCSTQHFAGRILQAQLSSRCFCQKTLSSGLDAKCLRTATPLSKQTSYVIRDFHLGVMRKKTEEKNGQCLSTAQFASASDRLTHVNEEGCASMVDIGMKPNSERTAVASAVVRLGEKAFILVQQNHMKKGDVLAVAQIAGIQGAKLTSQLIPLCHNIPLSLVDVSLKLDDKKHAVMIQAVCRTHGKTGVEMEALTAVSLAALTVYDMCKAVTHDMVIEEVQLLSKEGGQRGNFHRG